MSAIYGAIGAVLGVAMLNWVWDRVESWRAKRRAAPPAPPKPPRASAKLSDPD